MSTPNWADVPTLKSPMYLELTTVDATRDAALLLLGQMITDSMITYIDDPTLPVNNPPLALRRAALKQCCFEYKQRATPGLTSAQYQDGSINKYQAGEFLTEVEQIMKRYKRFALYESQPTVS